MSQPCPMAGLCRAHGARQGSKCCQVASAHPLALKAEGHTASLHQNPPLTSPVRPDLQNTAARCWRSSCVLLWQFEMKSKALEENLLSLYKLLLPNQILMQYTQAYMSSSSIFPTSPVQQLSLSSLWSGKRTLQTAILFFFFF